MAIIGGTGIGDRLAQLGGVAVAMPTPFGVFQCRQVEYEGAELFLVQRHSAGHKTPPHLVNYRAIATGMKQMGVQACFATAAVGSLRRDWGAGKIAVCSDFLDLTGRNLTLFDRVVEHTDFTEPFDPGCRAAVLTSAAQQGVAVEDGGIYLCGNGPRYESPFEIDWMARLGGDVIGMTAGSEAILCREAGVPYACISVVTNFGCGISETPLTHEEVVDEMNRVGPVVVQLLLGAVKLL